MKKTFMICGILMLLSGVSLGCSDDLNANVESSFALPPSIKAEGEFYSSTGEERPI